MEALRNCTCNCCKFLTLAGKTCHQGNQQLCLATETLLRNCRWKSCATKCAKFLLVAVNFVFLGLGIVLVSIGLCIYLDKYRSVYAHILNEIPAFGILIDFERMHILFVSIGVFVGLLSFLGCCGACSDSVCFLSMYSILLFVALMAQIVTTIIIVIYQHALLTNLELSMQQQIISEYNSSARPYNSTSSRINQITRAWDVFQIQFKCCGAAGIRDYKTSIWKNLTKNDFVVPPSCCVLADVTSASGGANSNDDKVASYMQRSPNSQIFHPNHPQHQHRRRDLKRTLHHHRHHRRRRHHHHNHPHHQLHRHHNHHHHHHSRRSPNRHNSLNNNHHQNHQYHHHHHLHHNDNNNNGDNVVDDYDFHAHPVPYNEDQCQIQAVILLGDLPPKDAPQPPPSSSSFPLSSFSSPQSSSSLSSSSSSYDEYVNEEMMRLEGTGGVLYPVAVHSVGCQNAFLNWLQPRIVIIVTVTCTVAVLQVAHFIFACSLLTSLKKSHDECRWSDEECEQ